MIKRSLLALAVLSTFSISGCAVETTDSKMLVPDASTVEAQYGDSWKDGVSLDTALEKTTDLTQNNTEDLTNLIGEGTRYGALKDIARDFGRRVGLYERRQELNKMLMRLQPQLDRIFNFSQYMLPGNVFPPVMEETQGSIEKVNDHELRYVRHTNHMLTNAVVMVEPPSYLNYLVRHYPKPEMPKGQMRLPRTETEKKNWELWLRQGWAFGRKQADIQYQSDLRIIKRDLKGVRLFHDLVAKGVISMPKMAQQNFGVVVSKDGRTMNVGDSVVSIVNHSEYQQPEDWKPLIREKIDE